MIFENARIGACALVAETTVGVSLEVGNVAAVGEGGALKDEEIGEPGAVVKAGDASHRVKEAVEEHERAAAWRNEKNSFLGGSSARTAGRALGSPSEWDY